MISVMAFHAVMAFLMPVVGAHAMMALVVPRAGPHAMMAVMMPMVGTHAVMAVMMSVAGPHAMMAVMMPAVGTHAMMAVVMSMVSASLRPHVTPLAVADVVGMMGHHPMVTGKTARAGHWPLVPGEAFMTGRHPVVTGKTARAGHRPLVPLKAPGAPGAHRTGAATPPLPGGFGHALEPGLHGVVDLRHACGEFFQAQLPVAVGVHRLEQSRQAGDAREGSLG
jgi:hypothetical protein